jgi:hypothetical protein
MKAVLIFFVSILFLLSCQKSEEPVLKRYQVKHGYIRYQTKVGENVRDERLYFDKWGIREAKHTDMLSNIGLKLSEQLTVTTIDSIYTVNHSQKTVFRTVNASKNMLYKYSIDELEKMNEQLLEMNKAKYLGEEAIEGKKCKKWLIEDMKTTLWIWKGITLKTKVEYRGNIQEITAVEVDESFIPNDSFFEIPKDYQIHDMESLMKQKSAKS